MGNIRTDVVRNLTTSLVLHNRVVTSRVKAKAVKQVIDRLLAKVAGNHDLTTRRALHGYLYNEKAVAKIFELIAPNLGQKRSGFVQTFKLPARRRDASDRTMLALLPELLTVNQLTTNLPTGQAGKKQVTVKSTETKNATNKEKRVAKKSAK